MDAASTTTGTPLLWAISQTWARGMALRLVIGAQRKATAAVFSPMAPSNSQGWEYLESPISTSLAPAAR